jgi:hypothetical protein
VLFVGFQSAITSMSSIMSTSKSVGSDALVAFVSRDDVSLVCDDAPLLTSSRDDVSLKKVCKKSVVH